MSVFTDFFEQFGISIHGSTHHIDSEAAIRDITLSNDAVTPDRYVSRFISLSVPPTSRLYIKDVDVFSEQFSIRSDLSRLHPYVLRHINLRFLTLRYGMQISFNDFSISDVLSPMEIQEALTLFSPSYSLQLLFEPNKKEFVHSNIIELDNFVRGFRLELLDAPTDHFRDSFLSHNNISIFS